MKNYFQKIITLFTGNDYPESTQQDFYKWLVDEEHTVEKERWNSFRTTKKNNPTDSYMAGCCGGFIYSSGFFRLPFYHR